MARKRLNNDFYFDLETTTVDDTGVELGVLVTEKLDDLVEFTLDNLGPNATTGFEIKIRSHKDAPWTPWLRDTDFNGGISAVDFVSSEGPHQLTANNSAIVRLHTHGVHALHFAADVGSGDSADLRLHGSVTPSRASRRGGSRLPLPKPGGRVG